MKKNQIRRSFGDAVFDWINLALLLLVVVLMLYPLYFTVVASLSDPYATARGETYFWVKDFTLDAYRNVFINKQIWSGYANSIFYTVVGTAIPILITGGFHVDGFLDTCDALHSYQPRERKLEILKDSHIGAFAVIMLALYGLIFLGGFSEITECRTLVVAGAGSFLCRVLSGVAVVSFPSAKQEGTLYLFADKAHKRVVKTALYAQGILCIGFMMWTSFVTGGIAVAAALLTFAYYYYRSKKEFGGITGDTAGYFVTFCEGCVVVAAAIAEHMMLTV